MTKRAAIIQGIANTILLLPTRQVIRLAIHGVDGAGKTVFGDELAEFLEAQGRHIIRASVDSFHNPKILRYRQGRQSPAGYFADSYNYAELTTVLLDPLSPGGNGQYRTAIFDHRTDMPVSMPEAQANAGDILIFDGIFLHRQELRAYWDFSIFLEVGFAVSIPRGAQRDGSSPDPQAPENRRYVEGQQLYLRTCQPQQYANLVINNEILESPFIVAGIQ